MERMAGNCALGAFNVAFMMGEFERYCWMARCAATVVPPEMMLKLPDRISAGVVLGRDACLGVLDAGSPGAGFGLLRSDTKFQTPCLFLMSSTLGRFKP